MSRYRDERLGRLRELPLGTVAAALGYRPDPRDRARWKKDGSVLSIHGTKFYDHLRQTGGGGAIDLVLHDRQCLFHDAVHTLESIAPTGTVDPPDGAAWAAVRGYLCWERSLDPDLVDRCHQQGIVSADRRHNAVFAMLDPDGRTVGAEIVGTRQGGERPRFRGLAKGSSRKRGGFRIHCPRHQKPRLGGAVLIVESAIDALSAWSLPLTEKPDFILSTAGAMGKLPPWLTPERVHTIWCGYDADPAGDLCAESLQTDPRVKRLRPRGNGIQIKDWNDILTLSAY